MRCACCKEVGHAIEDCPRDPNFRTQNPDTAEEDKRIKGISVVKRLFADTLVTTTHMLKKCIKVPKVTLKSPEYPSGLGQAEYSAALARQKLEPFKRGAMSFEDYNYDHFNKFILIDPTRTEEDPYQPMPVSKNGSVFEPQIVEKDKFGKIKSGCSESHDQGSKLSDIMLNEAQYRDSKYYHEILDVDTEAEKEKK